MEDRFTKNQTEGNAQEERIVDAGCELARDAIEQKNYKAEKIKERMDCIYSRAETFIQECVDKNENPIDIIEFIAKRDEISLSGDRPEDDRKAETYDVLKAAIKILAVSCGEFRGDRASQKYACRGFDFGRNEKTVYFMRSPFVGFCHVFRV